ncbi:MAG: LapA family protein [Spirochaetia bacterium]|nr:LapA family protein [Spirochaetia bacterium]
MLRKIINFLIIAFIVLITIISMMNLHPVSFVIFFYTIEVPLIILIFALLFVGFSAGYMIKSLSVLRKKKSSKTDQ